MAAVVNEGKGIVVAENVHVADGIWPRFRGLMGRKGLAAGEALLLVPGSSIHTCFMRFPIDAVFLDVTSRVVKVVPALRPFRVAFGSSGARSVLELEAGAAARAAVEPGDRLVMVEGS